ncbi:hypothetical protein Esti_001592 [Eimeria stiedai]
MITGSLTFLAAFRFSTFRDNSELLKRERGGDARGAVTAATTATTAATPSAVKCEDTKKKTISDSIAAAAA